MLVAGATFTALLFALPLAHLGQPLTAPVIALSTAPLIVLLALLLRPRLAYLSHLAFPLAHLPLLLLRPELAGPRIYGGPSGLVAFAAVIGAGAAFFVTVDPRLEARAARPSVLPWVGLLLTLAVTFSLFAPALAAPKAPWGALLAVALAPLLSWWLVARLLTRDVALPTLAASHRVRALYRLRERSRPRTSRLVLAAFLTVPALALTALWYLWSPR